MGKEPRSAMRRMGGQWNARVGRTRRGARLRYPSLAQGAAAGAAAVMIAFIAAFSLTGATPNGAKPSPADSQRAAPVASDEAPAPTAARLSGVAPLPALAARPRPRRHARIALDSRPVPTPTVVPTPTPTPTPTATAEATQPAPPAAAPRPPAATPAPTATSQPSPPPSGSFDTSGEESDPPP